jgi:hypothetical protein
LDISPNSSSHDEDDGILEVCNLSHDDIRKVTSFSWAADTGASSPMSDQRSIFKQMIPIKHQHIQVRGRIVYSEAKGIVDLKY